MEELIYNNDILGKHSLSCHCMSTLNTVSQRDYGNRYPFDPGIKCLDIDTYEKDILRKDLSFRTGDAVIGISTYQDNTAKAPRLLIVELRMGYDNPSNLSKSAITDKIDYTKSLLGGEITINKESILVFKDEIISQARSWLNRQSKTNGQLKLCIPCSVSEFGSIIRSAEDYPYTPTHSELKIRNSIANHPEPLEQIRFWCKQAETYRLRHNKPEFRHIAKVLAEIWITFKADPQKYSPDEILEIEITEEDFGFLTHPPLD